MEESILPHQTSGNHARDPSTVGHIISEQHWKSAFDFTEIVNSMSNCEIYFPIFSENIHTILKIFHSMFLGSIGRGYRKKI